jgi:hypothetical protein
MNKTTIQRTDCNTAINAHGNDVQAPKRIYTTLPEVVCQEATLEWLVR